MSEESDRHPVQFTLYTRPQCQLCDRLEGLIAPKLDALRRRGVEATLVKCNIDDDSELRRRYGLRIPVLTVDGDELLEGRPQAGDVERAFRNLLRR